MVQICSPIFAFAFLVVIQPVSSLLERNIGDLRFTIPDEAKNFDDAVSWCMENYSSTLAVVNDSDTQTALEQFLKSNSVPSEPIYINIRLDQEQTASWFLINGSTYKGGIGNMNPADSWWTRYLLYCHLQSNSGNSNNYLVVASKPGERRYYICQYDENRCTNDSARNIVYMGKCYVKYENESLAWYQARERCVNSGGDLATFQSDPRDWWISPKQFNTSWLNISSTYWVGIRYKNWSWKYTYEDNQEAIFTSWSIGEPNNYSFGCACVDPNENLSCSWTDCDCSTQRQFICLKKAPIQTTTRMPTTQIITTTRLTDITTNSVTKLVTTTNSNKTTSETQTGLSMSTIIGLAVGIGGGGLIILIVIVVLVVIFKRRRSRRSKGSDGSTSKMQGVVGDSDKPENGGGVYAAVVPNGKHQGKTTDPRSEIIYTSPEFTKELNSKGHTNSSYEDANSVKDPDTISTFRGQTRSIFPQGFTDLYANADEVPKSID